MKLTGIEIFDKLKSEEQQNEIIKAIEDKFIHLDFISVADSSINLVIDNNNYNNININTSLQKYQDEDYGWDHVTYVKFCSNGYDPKICTTDKIEIYFSKYKVPARFINSKNN